MFEPIHHVSLLTRHGQVNADFYTNLLGLRFVKKTVNQDNHKMLHYYYGDYEGTPGSVVTFFVVPKLGNRYENDHYLSTIGLKLPKGAMEFWQARLTSFQIAFEKKGKTLIFSDPDNVTLYLTETAEPPLPRSKQVKNEIPGNKQLIGLQSTQLHVPDVDKTKNFFKKLLDWTVEGNHIKLSESDFLEIIGTDSKSASHMGRGSMDHIAFSVKDEQTLDVLHQKALSQGWFIEKIVSRGYFKSLYIREPGGNRMEFATLSPGFTLDEPLESLGESFALPPFLESQRKEIEANIYAER